MVSCLRLDNVFGVTYLATLTHMEIIYHAHCSSAKTHAILVPYTRAVIESLDLNPERKREGFTKPKQVHRLLNS